ncbi:MAG: PLP-dependent transferase [Brevundimonas sp.]|nr:PLP-dependent transferase [Brevundimonas sp.]MDI1327194.1 PLP-dependent transferase [Brevundimonas sp.]
MNILSNACFESRPYVARYPARQFKNFELGAELDRITEVISDRTRVVFFETPTNPNMEIIDIAAVARVANACGSRTAP